MANFLSSLVAFFIVVLLIYFVGQSKCETYAEEVQVGHKYSLIAGCRIYQNGRYVPINNYRWLNENKE
ncbi:MAG: hypothetical protein LBD84_07625 [Campylobacteraceae bacterium]|nr:hypothetical protein [Campylobacteraceae bacterium]